MLTRASTLEQSLVSFRCSYIQNNGEDNALVICNHAPAAENSGDFETPTLRGQQACKTTAVLPHSLSCFLWHPYHVCLGLSNP